MNQIKQLTIFVSFQKKSWRQFQMLILFCRHFIFDCITIYTNQMKVKCTRAFFIFTFSSSFCFFCVGWFVVFLWILPNYKGICIQKHNRTCWCSSCSASLYCSNKDKKCWRFCFFLLLLLLICLCKRIQTVIDQLNVFKFK